MQKPTLTASIAACALGFAVLVGGEAAPDTGPPAVTVRLAAVTIVTENFDDMVAFYRDQLGFVVHQSNGEYATFADSNLAIISGKAMREASGSDRFSGDVGRQPFELAFQLQTPDAVDALHEQLRRNETTIVAPPRDTPWGQRSFYFADPDGNVHDVFAIIVAAPDSP